MLSLMITAYYAKASAVYLLELIISSSFLNVSLQANSAVGSCGHSVMQYQIECCHSGKFDVHIEGELLHI